jgi:hypothetical protein
MCRICRTNALRRRAMAEVKAIDDGEPLDPQSLRELLMDMVSDGHAYVELLRVMQVVFASADVQVVTEAPEHVH